MSGQQRQRVAGGESLLTCIQLFTAEVAGGSLAIGHGEVTASVREDLCLPMASSWPKCRHLIGGNIRRINKQQRPGITMVQWSSIQYPAFIDSHDNLSCN